MKAFLWNILVGIAGFFPGTLMRQFCRLIFASFANKSPADGSMALLALLDDLYWYLDESAIRYEGGVHPKLRLTRYHLFFTEKLKHNERVLDVGCGIGAVAYSMAEAGALVTGVDIDRKNIDAARRKYSHPGVKYICGDVTTDIGNGQL